MAGGSGKTSAGAAPEGPNRDRAKFLVEQIAGMLLRPYRGGSLIAMRTNSHTLRTRQCES
jgi:hypothetical protein